MKLYFCVVRFGDFSMEEAFQCGQKDTMGDPIYKLGSINDIVYAIEKVKGTQKLVTYCFSSYLMVAMV